MKFIYEDNRNRREIRITDAAIRNDWTVSDIFYKGKIFFQIIKLRSKD